MRGRLGRALLAAASFALAFVLLELGLRVAGYEPIYAVYSRPSIFLGLLSRKCSLSYRRSK